MARKVKSRKGKVSGSPGLNARQRAFVEAYAANPVASAAAKQAGYKGNAHSLETLGSRLLRNPKVRELIEERLEEASEKRIATADRIQQVWTEVLEGKAVRDVHGYKRLPDFSDRLKAGELLAKVHGLFVEKKKTELTGAVTITVKRGE